MLRELANTDASYSSMHYQITKPPATMRPRAEGLKNRTISFWIIDKAQRKGWRPDWSIRWDGPQDRRRWYFLSKTTLILVCSPLTQQSPGKAISSLGKDRLVVKGVERTVDPVV